MKGLEFGVRGRQGGDDDCYDYEYYSVDAVVRCVKIMKYYDAVLCAFKDGGDEGGSWQSDDY